MKTANEYPVKAPSKTKMVVFAVIVACLVVAATGSAFAANPILRNTSDQTFEGQCCFSFGETVSINEPATPVAVLITWSSDYAVNVADAYFVGLSVNGGACETLSYGARVLADNPGPGSGYTTAAFQWTVLPGDGVLVKGTNTFELCGGGKNSPSDSITIGENVLAVAK
jgi:hypothetical protein